MSLDIYTDVERSIYMHLDAVIKSQGWDYPIFNNMATKKDFPNSPGAISIMKVSDVPNFANGGGPTAVLSEVATKDVDGNPLTLSQQDWPQFFDVLYQVTVLADYVEDARKLDWVVRRALPPRKNLLLYDSEKNVWTTSSIFLSYAGYINRDVPESCQFWRCNNVRVEVPDYKPETSRIIPVITQATVGVAPVELTIGNVDVDIIQTSEL